MAQCIAAGFENGAEPLVAEPTVAVCQPAPVVLAISHSHLVENIVAGDNAEASRCLRSIDGLGSRIVVVAAAAQGLAGLDDVYLALVVAECDRDGGDVATTIVVAGRRAPLATVADE